MSSIAIDHQLIGSILFLIRIYLLLAAHCTTGYTAGQMRLFFGKHDLFGQDPDVTFTVVDAIHNHPDYNNVTLENDVAILSLRPGLHIPFNDFNRDICMPRLVRNITHTCIVCNSCTPVHQMNQNKI